MNGSNISQTAINILTLGGPKGGINQGFYVALPRRFPETTPLANPISFAQPTRANEDQYLANLDWVVNSKNTLSERFFTSKDPQQQSFVCLPGGGTILNSCAPGAPEDVAYTADSGVLKLTTVQTSNFVNEALFSFQRATTKAAPGTYISACAVGITPPLLNETGCPGPGGINPIPLQIPTISFAGLPLTGPTGFSQGPLNTSGKLLRIGDELLQHVPGTRPGFVESRQARNPGRVRSGSHPVQLDAAFARRFDLPRRREFPDERCGAGKHPW